MEEAIVDVDIALDLNLPPVENPFQQGVQKGMLTDNRNQTRFLASIQKGCQASRRWPLSRAARVEALRQSIASGTYRVDSADLALSIWCNSTCFLETRPAVAGTS